MFCCNLRFQGAPTATKSSTVKVLSHSGPAHHRLRQRRQCGSAVLARWQTHRFMSNRSGSWQIWVSSADGSNPMEVSSTESAGTPRWSPDGRSIAFDGPLLGRTHIYVVGVDSREVPRPLVEELVPSFSRDGKWVYFASDRSGGWQVWRVPVAGGSAQQLSAKAGSRRWNPATAFFTTPSHAIPIRKFGECPSQGMTRNGYHRG